MLTRESMMFCQKVVASAASGIKAEQPMMAMGSKGPWSVPLTSFPSAVVIVIFPPHSMMVSGTIVIEYPASTWMTWPVTPAERGLANHNVVPATSDCVTFRRSGALDAT